MQFIVNTWCCIKTDVTKAKVNTRIELGAAVFRNLAGIRPAQI